MLDETFRLVSVNSSEDIYLYDDTFGHLLNPSMQILDFQNEIHLLNKKSFENKKIIDNKINYENFNFCAEENKESGLDKDKYNNNINNEKLSLYCNLDKETKNISVPDKKLLTSTNNKNNNNQMKRVYKININNSFFPFTPGKRKNNAVNYKLSDESNSFIKINEIKNNELDSEKSSKENSTNPEQIINNIKNIHDLQFMTKKYLVMPDGKKRKIKKIRKFKSDNIRKKIKSRFHKTLKDLINEGLKIAGSKKLFDFIPHFFVNNVTRKINSKFFDLSYKELLSYNFINEQYNEKALNKEADYKKFLKNQEVLKYLEKNENICKESGFDLISGKKYKDLLTTYFSSFEFENSIIRLKKENENNDYIQEYIFIAKHYVEFFSNDNYDENEEIENNGNINI